MIPKRLLTSLAKTSLVRSFASDAKGEVTALYGFHQQHGGKIVNFGGYMLPVQYSDLGIAASHIHTRKSASLFDVSHMLQTEVVGKDCIDYLESVCTADLHGLDLNSAVLTVFTDANGGILDDLIVSKIQEDHLFIVSNAARKQHDQQHLLRALDSHKKKNPSTNIKMTFFDPKERSLVALQGPQASQALQSLTDVDLDRLFFMNTTVGNVGGICECRITRCGYTGEDGFEISMPSDKAVQIAELLLKSRDVKLAGLGARDSLRLEAGLCLYGNDITTDTTPVEGALTWLVSKKRREAKNFPGAEAILRQIKEGSQKKRIGLVAESGPPARQGALVVSEDGNEIGKVTSGCPAPSLGKNIAMAYVPTGLSKVGTKMGLKIRDKVYPAVVSKMPFVPSHYYNKPKK